MRLPTAIYSKPTATLDGLRLTAYYRRPDGWLCGHDHFEMAEEWLSTPGATSLEMEKDGWYRVGTMYGNGYLSAQKLEVNVVRRIIIDLLDNNLINYSDTFDISRNLDLWIVPVADLVDGNWSPLNPTASLEKECKMEIPFGQDYIAFVRLPGRSPAMGTPIGMDGGFVTIDFGGIKTPVDPNEIDHITQYDPEVGDDIVVWTPSYGIVASKTSQFWDTVLSDRTQCALVSGSTVLFTGSFEDCVFQRQILGGEIMVLSDVPQWMLDKTAERKNASYDEMMEKAKGNSFTNGGAWTVVNIPLSTHEQADSVVMRAFGPYVVDYDQDGSSVSLIVNDTFDGTIKLFEQLNNEYDLWKFVDGETVIETVTREASRKQAGTIAPHWIGTRGELGWFSADANFLSDNIITPSGTEATLVEGSWNEDWTRAVYDDGTMTWMLSIESNGSGGFIARSPGITASKTAQRTAQSKLMSSKEIRDAFASLGYTVKMKRVHNDLARASGVVLKVFRSDGSLVNKGMYRQDELDAEPEVFALINSLDEVRLSDMVDYDGKNLVVLASKTAKTRTAGKTAQASTFAVGDRVQIDFPTGGGTMGRTYTGTIEDIQGNDTVSIRYDGSNSLGVLIEQEFLTVLPPVRTAQADEYPLTFNSTLDEVNAALDKLIAEYGLKTLDEVLAALIYNVGWDDELYESIANLGLDYHATIQSRLGKNASKTAQDWKSAPDVSKLIRQVLKESFGGTKFSVKTSSYSGGASIRISYMDGPSLNLVQDTVRKFEGASFDGMIDLKTYNDPIQHGDQTFRSGADFIFVERNISVPLAKRWVAEICKKWGYDASTIPVTDGWQGAANIDWRALPFDEGEHCRREYYKNVSTLDANGKTANSRTASRHFSDTERDEIENESVGKRARNFDRINGVEIEIGTDDLFM